MQVIKKTGKLKIWYLLLAMMLAMAIALWAISQEIRSTDRQLEKLENHKK